MITMIFIFLLPMMYAVHGNKVSIHIDMNVNVSKNQVANKSDICPSHTSPPGLWIASGVPGAPTCADFGAVPTNISGSGGQCYTFCKLQLEQKTRFFAWFWQALVNIFQQVNSDPEPTTADPTSIGPTTTTTTMKKTTTGASSEEVSWSAIKNACIKGNNDKIYDPVTIEVCKEKCEEEVSIDCKAIEYSDKLQMCSLSEATSDSEDYIEPCSSDGWVFAEIELKKLPTTGPPTTTAPANTTNVTSCNLVWDNEEFRPLIMIRESHIIIPPISADISDDPNRIPGGLKLIFACPGENNEFTNIDGLHTKLHGQCNSSDLFKICVNNYAEIMSLTELSCRKKMTPSLIKQDNDTSYKKKCEEIGGELFKMGYIYGDNREFKDLETKVCFREENQTTLWTSTNVNRIKISTSMQSKDPTNFRAAQGFAMNTVSAQEIQQEMLKDILDKEAASVWNDKACQNHGGHCVRGGRPCPVNLPHQTSQGEPFCSSFYRCCYSDQCNPTTCTYKGQTGHCSLQSLPGTTGVGSQDCMKECQCYIQDNNTLRPLNIFKNWKKETRKKRKCEDPVVPACKKPKPGKKCKVVWDSNNAGAAPLILTQLPCNDFEILSDDEVGDGSKLRFSCPNFGNNDVCPDANSFYHDSESPYIDLECNDGVLLGSEPMSKLGCETWVQATIEPDSITRVQKTCKRDGLNGKWYILGLKGKTSALPDKSKSKTFELLSFCYNTKNMTTLMTKHIILKKPKTLDNFKTPDFRLKNKPKNFFNTLSMATIYKQKNQETLFENIKTTMDGSSLSCTYLERGHMAPKADFGSDSGQDGTYYYVNAQPQWKTINNGHWKNIESGIRVLDNSYFPLTIYTGGFEVLEIDTVELYLSNSYPVTAYKDKVPVPKSTWKVVWSRSKNEAVAFMVSNNPFITAAPVIPNNVPNRCNQLAGWTLNINNNIFAKGFTACFTIDEFRIAYDTIELPEIPNNLNLLL